MAEEGNDHLRRGVHVILALDERVGLRVDSAFAPDHADPVGFDDEFLAGFVADVPFATGLVGVAEQFVPGLGVGGFAGQGADGVGDHGVDAVLSGMVFFPPVIVAWARPVGGLGVMDPDDAAGMDAFGFADGRQRVRVPGVESLDGGGGDEPSGGDTGERKEFEGQAFHSMRTTGWSD